MMKGVVIQSMREVSDLPILLPVAVPGGYLLSEVDADPESIRGLAESSVESMRGRALLGVRCSSLTAGPDDPVGCWDDVHEAVRVADEVSQSLLFLWSHFRKWWVMSRGEMPLGHRQKVHDILGGFIYAVDWARVRAYTGTVLYDAGAIDDDLGAAHFGYMHTFMNLLEGPGRIYSAKGHRLSRAEVKRAFDSVYRAFHPQFDEFLFYAIASLSGNEGIHYQPRTADGILFTGEPEGDYFDFLADQLG